MKHAQAPKNVTRVGQEPRQSNWNLPNALTTIRLILVPVFIVLMLQDGTGFRWAALAVFVVAGYTDRLDGKIARSRGIITDFGRLADPIADKALVLGAFIMLSWVLLLPWWFTIIIAVRELGITLMRAILVRRQIVVSANRLGKLKTVLQMGLIAFLLVPWGLPQLEAGEGGIPTAVTWIGVFLAAAVLAITVYSGVIYMMEGIRLWRETEPTAPSAGGSHAALPASVTAALPAGASTETTPSARKATPAPAPAPAHSQPESEGGETSAPQIVDAEAVVVEDDQAKN